MANTQQKLKVRGVTISEPVLQPFGHAVRVLKWTGSRGEVHLKVVPAKSTAESIERVVRHHVSGTQYIFVDAAAPA